VGLTTYQVGSNNNFVDGKVFVRLNDYPYVVNAAGHRQAACHEQGHALGMGHNTSTSSCLYFQITNATGSQGPNNDDFSLIAGVYSVAH
jgi:predicted Zn-dependent protease